MRIGHPDTGWPQGKSWRFRDDEKWTKGSRLLARIPPGVPQVVTAPTIAASAILSLARHEA